MDRHLFVAETETADTVNHVWVQKGTCRPRPVRPEDVTADTLQAAEFHGAPKDAILKWLNRCSTSQ